MGIEVEYGKRRLYCLGLSGILQKNELIGVRKMQLRFCLIDYCSSEAKILSHLALQYE